MKRGSRMAARGWALLLAATVIASGAVAVQAEDKPSYATETECMEASGIGCFMDGDYRWRPDAGPTEGQTTNFTGDWIEHMERATPGSVKGTAESPVVIVDMEQVSFPDVQPVLDPAIGRVRVPVRFVSEKMGAKVSWEQSTKTVTVTREDLRISMQVDNPTVVVNGVLFTLDAPPVLVNDRVLVPLRYISELYGAKVDWVGDQPPAGRSEYQYLGRYQVWIWIPWGYWGTADLATRLTTDFYRRN